MLEIEHLVCKIRLEPVVMGFPLSKDRAMTFGDLVQIMGDLEIRMLLLLSVINIMSQIGFKHNYSGKPL